MAGGLRLEVDTRSHIRGLYLLHRVTSDDSTPLEFQDACKDEVRSPEEVLLVEMPP